MRFDVSHFLEEFITGGERNHDGYMSFREKKIVLWNVSQRKNCGPTALFTAFGFAYPNNAEWWDWYRLKFAIRGILYKIYFKLSSKTSWKKKTRQDDEKKFFGREDDKKKERINNRNLFCFSPAGRRAVSARQHHRRRRRRRGELLTGALTTVLKCLHI